MTRATILRPGSHGPDDAALRDCCRVLESGGIVAHPTETLYGLAVDPWNEAAVARLDGIKARGAGAGYVLIASSREEALGLAASPWPRHLSALGDAFWPGPLTLVLPPSERAPALACRSGSGIAVRVTPDPIAASLVAAFGRPLTSTSANRRGGTPAVSAAEVLAALGEEIDRILDGGPRGAGVPSTIVDLTRAEPAILRIGALSEERIREVLRAAGAA